MQAILKVRQGGTDFYVLAEKNFIVPGKKYVDYSTKQPFDPKELSYSLTKLVNGKPKAFMGYVSNISPKHSQVIRIPVKVSKANSTCSYTSEFKLEILHSIQKVYDFE